MKVICDRAALLNAVNIVAGVVQSRSPRPALTCIKLSAQKDKPGGAAGTLTLSGTDAEVGIRMSTSSVEVQKEGEALIPADKLRSIVAAEEGEPTLTIETESNGEQCRITGRDGYFKVFGYPPADFPAAAEFPKGGEVFAVDAATLSQLIARTVFSTARDNSRYAIAGVLLKRDGKKLEMVATDGRRLAVAKANAEGAAGSGTCIVPTKALSLLQKLLSGAPEDKVRIAVSENRIIFGLDDAEAGGTVLASNLVEGTFPPYEDVIPKDQDKRATFDVNVLSSAVRRAALLSNEESRGVEMNFGGKNKTLKIESRAPEMGESSFEVEMTGYEGGEIKIGFNPAFIVDALKVVPGEQVILELKSPNKPGLIRSGSDFVYVVMPVSLQ